MMTVDQGCLRLVWWLGRGEKVFVGRRRAEGASARGVAMQRAAADLNEGR